MEARGKRCELAAIIAELCARGVCTNNIVSAGSGGNNNGGGNAGGGGGSLVGDSNYANPSGSSSTNSSSSSSSGKCDTCIGIRTSLSAESNHSFHCAVATLMADAVLNELVLCQDFNEWGAILLQQEVRIMVSYDNTGS